MAEVLMRRQGNIVDISPVTGIDAAGLFQLLQGSLKYSLKVRNDRTTAIATGRKLSFETKYLCQLQRNEHGSSIIIPAGLVNRTTGMFKQCDIVWELKDLRPTILPSPAIDRLELSKMANRDDQLKCLAAIFTSDMGVIEAPTGIGKTFIVCQLCRAYPTARIIICTYRRDVASSIYERLRYEGHVSLHDLGVVGGGKRRARRVTVSTIDSVEYANPEKCQLFLYDEVHEAASEERMRKISQIRDSHMFGFSASPRGRADGADLAIEAMFGPVIYVLPYQEAEASGNIATISVDMYRVPGVSIPYDDDVAQYRYGVWRNDIRNHMVAKVAADHALQNKQVLVMVDKVEHALMLKSQFLPTWPIVHGDVQAEQVRTFRRLNVLPDLKWLCTSDQRENYRQRFERGKMRYAIATGVWSQGVDMKHLDVLVRADAKSSPISNTQIPGRLSRGDAGLLVDFMDSFDARFERRSQARVRAYTGKGWKITHR